jgi:hypothetical protein
MLIKANKLDGTKDLLEELFKSDPQDKDIFFSSRIKFILWKN